MPDLTIRIVGDSESGQRAVTDLENRFDDLSDEIRSTLKEAGDAGERSASRIRGAFGGTLIRSIGRAFSAIPSIIGGVFSTAAGIAGKALSGLVSVVRGIVGAIGSIISGIADAFGLVFNKVTAIVAAASAFVVKRLGDQAVAFEGLDKGLQNLAKSAGTSAEAIRSAINRGSKGTIDALTAMRLANTALTLDVARTPEEFERLAEIATVLAATMGIDVTRAFESVVVGIGRQSRLWLDNIGIIVDADKVYEDLAARLGKTTAELTDMEKKQAFANEAIRQGTDLVERSGGAIGGLTLTFGRLRVAFVDTFTDLARLVAPSLQLVAEQMIPIVDRFREWASANREVVASRITEFVQDMIDRATVWRDRIAEFVPLVRDKLSEAWDFAKNAADTAFDVVLQVIVGARQEVELLIAALRGDGFDASQSLLLTGLDVIRARVAEAAVEIGISFARSFGGAAEAGVNFARDVQQFIRDLEATARGAVAGIADSFATLQRFSPVGQLFGLDESAQAFAAEQRRQAVELRTPLQPLGARRSEILSGLEARLGPAQERTAAATEAFRDALDQSQVPQRAEDVRDRIEEAVGLSAENDQRTEQALDGVVGVLQVQVDHEAIRQARLDELALKIEAILGIQRTLDPTGATATNVQAAN